MSLDFPPPVRSSCLFAFVLLQRVTVCLRGKGAEQAISFFRNDFRPLFSKVGNSGLHCMILDCCDGVFYGVFLDGAAPGRGRWVWRRRRLWITLWKGY